MTNTSDNITVSVCMITYNHEKFIRQAIEGVLMQKTDFPIELVIGEDYSTDRTRAICDEYAASHPAVIRILASKKNMGIMPNFIRTLNSCTGKYIALCEGDDYWMDPMKLQKQVEFLENNSDFSGSFHETQLIYSKSQRKGRIFGREAPQEVIPSDTISILALFHTSSFVFRAMSIEKVPDWLFKVKSGDMALFSIVSAFGLIKKVDGIMSVYRKHDQGITSAVYIMSTYHEDRIELIRMLDEFHDFRYKDKAKDVIEYHEREISELNKKKGRRFPWIYFNWCYEIYYNAKRRILS